MVFEKMVEYQNVFKTLSTLRTKVRLAQEHLNGPAAEKA